MIILVFAAVDEVAELMIYGLVNLAVVLAATTTTLALDSKPNV